MQRRRRRRMAVGVACVMFLFAAVVFVRAAEPGDKPKKQGMGRLTQPWSKISTLSEEQKTKIREIHGKAVAEINAIREKETADIIALLSEEQKAEAQKLLNEQRKSRPSAAQTEGDPSNEKKVEEKKSAPAE
jgi:Spy/CpxP family protein refolding chaperone